MISRFSLSFLTLLFGLVYPGIAQPPTLEKMEQARVHFGNGVRLGIEKEFQQAVAEFDKAIELNPLYAEAFLYKGIARIELGDFEKAIRDFTITIELDPAFSDQAHYFRGLARYYKDELVEAIDDFTVAIRMNPDYVAFYQRGKANLKLREFRRSINDFEIAIRLNPDFYEAYLYRGINLYFLEEYEYAIEDLEIAKRRLPNNPDAFYYSGLARTAIQNSYVAIEDLNRAIELDPAYAPAYEARAAARANTGDRELAHRDRALAAQQQQAQTNQATAPRPTTAQPQNTAQEIAPVQDIAPRTSTEINFAELFSAGRSQQTQPEEDTETEPQPTFAPIAVVAGASTPAASARQETSAAPAGGTVSLTRLSSGTYSTQLDQVRPAGFGVQVASYSNTDNLLSLANAYKEKYNQPVFINISATNGRTLYKLIVGSFAARGQAENFRDELRRGDFPDSFLVVFDNL